uniref:Uncharacterized protein n=1 Tax=Arundo donax TaxID=35708 RepID=A0A0A9AUD2_ARUDO
MEKPEGFKIPPEENKVSRLIKSLYGRKQAQNNGTKNLTTL